MSRCLSISTHAEHFGHRQSELGAIAAGRLPATGTARGQLGPHADARPHTHPLGVMQHQFQVGEFLQHRNDLPPHLLGQHGHLEELAVLEPVADDRRVGVGHGDDGQQFRFAARFQAKSVGHAEADNLLDDLPLLIHLDRDRRTSSRPCSRTL